jgi:two-component system, OmpR family, sensor histidine kinase KdpD
VTLLGWKWHLNAATAELFYLLVIALQSRHGPFSASCLTCIVATLTLDYFFFPPVLTLRITHPNDGFTLATFLIIALINTRLASRAEEALQVARRHQGELQQVYEAARELLVLEPTEIVPLRTAEIFYRVFDLAAVCIFDGATTEAHTKGQSTHHLVEQTRRAYFRDEDSDDPSNDISLRRLQTAGKTIGALGLKGPADPQFIAGPLAALANAALERSRALQDASQAAAAAQAEIFRTAILDALAHEFKTPLATILTLIGGFREARAFAPQDIEMADTIESQVTRLNSLTNRLLRMARIGSEEVTPRMELTDLEASAKRIIQQAATQYSEERILFVSAGGKATVLADVELLHLAFTQLVDNALKYSPPASVVSVRISLENGWAVVRVENEAAPIPPAERDRIFERFYRGAAIRDNVSGAGLGLYVARKIAVAHGGGVDLELNSSGNKVVFYLRLPFRSDDAHDERSHN